MSSVISNLKIILMGYQGKCNAWISSHKYIFRNKRILDYEQVKINRL